MAGLERPVIHFRGQRDGRLRLSATVTGDREVVVEGRPIARRRLGEIAGTVFHAADFEIDAADRTVDYAVDGWPERFHVSAGALRLAYTSCNGGEDEDRARAYPTGRNAMWRDLLEDPCA